MTSASEPPLFSAPFDVVRPRAWEMPAIFNSPHSGRHYPAAFLALTRLDPLALRRSEDFRIDELFGAAAAMGAPMLRAHFPRCFLDVNREPYELDPKLFAERLPGFANCGSVRVAGGLGTIPRIVSEGEEIYRSPIPLGEALARIETYYRPYHRALAQLIEEAQLRFGAVLVVDCHSMPSNAQGAQADIVLGDRYGSSAAEELTGLCEALLRREGFSVARNKPYAGGFIAQNYGAPRQGRHVLQVEVNRALYMNERTMQTLGGFARVAERLGRTISGLRAALPQLLDPHPMAAE